MSLNLIDQYHCAELLETFSASINVNQAQSDALKACQNELANLLSEMAACNAEIEELVEQKEQIEEKSLAGKRQETKYQTLNIMQKKLEGELATEIEALLAKESKVKTLIETTNKTREQKRRNKTHEGQMNLLRNDYEILNEVEMTQLKMINSFTPQSDPKQSFESNLLKKHLLIELLLGIKIWDKSNKSSGSEAGDHGDLIEIDVTEPTPRGGQSWFEICFANLPDDCLFSEKNFEHLNQWPGLKKRMMDLSPSLLDSYRSIFKKRKQKMQNEKSKKEKASQQPGGCVIVDNVNDFQIIYGDYENLMCNILTKHEIEEAMRTFAIDWIEGSQIITILINSKSSKIATAFVPKYYPLCGTSMIKLISLTGYDDDVARKFKIDNELGSLSEWIAQFTEMYNNNKIAAPAPEPLKA